MKNILLPTDFSENSWNAIEYAVNFFKDSSCNFYLLHVTLISNYASADAPIIPTSTVIEETLVKIAKTRLLKMIKKVKTKHNNPKHNFFSVCSYDYFVDAIRNQISEKNIDLVVMGTKGASGLKKVIMGSNTGDLITKVKTLVLVVPEKAVFKKPKEIAFPTDFNMFYQTEILKNISRFAKMFKSKLRILHVAKREDGLSTFQNENKEYLDDFFEGVSHSFHRVTNKKIEAGVECFVESRDIDLLIMVAKNLTLFQQIMFKPMVEEISYHIKVPFLVLHE